MSRLYCRFAVKSMVLVFFGYILINTVQNGVNLCTIPTMFRYGDQLSEVNNSFMANTGDQDGELLMCEKVWNDVMSFCTRKFTSEINPGHFVVNEYLDFVSVNNSICENVGSNSSDERLLLVMVSSTRSHFNERKLVRETWGSQSSYSGGWSIRIVFLLGQSKYCLVGDNESQQIVAGSKTWNDTKDEERKLDDEQKQWGDLIVGSFTDTYRNNTYRHLMGYKFVLEKCRQAEFIVKTDDDVFVNIPMILDKRSEETKNPKPNGSDLYCKVMEKTAPARCKKCKREKWFTTKEEWPTEEYPTFCLGGFLGVTKKWVEILYGVKNLGGFFWIDDILILGKFREIAENELGVKAKMMNINKLVRFDIPKGLCKKVTHENLSGKRKRLPMFLHVARGKNFEGQMKCLSNIMMGTCLPFSV